MEKQPEVKTSLHTLPSDVQDHIRWLEKTIERLLLKLQKKGRAEKRLREQSRQRPTTQ